MTRSARKVPYYYFIPAVGILLFLSYFPMPYALYLSMTQKRPGAGTIEFIGLDRFYQLFRDRDFTESLLNTVKYAFGETFLLMIAGLVLALMFDRSLKLKGLYMTIVFIPWVVSEVVAGWTWRWMFNPDFGLLNYMFGFTGWKVSDLLQSPNGAMLVAILVAVWRNAAFSMVIILASLQSISREMIEAAKIDGCTYLRTLTSIVLPLIRPTLAVLTLLLLINAVNQTGTLLVLTNGGPVRATETLSLFMYREAFFNYRLNNAASLVVVLGLINVLIAVVYFRFIKLKGDSME